MATEPGQTGPAPLPFERPLGARPLDDERTEFRVWAPRAEQVRLRIGREELAMEPVGYGVHELIAPAPPGTDYFYALGRRRFPDPASRSQPDGLRGPSRVFAPGAALPGAASPRAGSTASRFRAAPLAQQVIYELHIGTFSADGSFDGAIPYLQGLAELGITAVEVMPVAEFPGARGWGYDGVYLSAAQSSYGGPEGFERFIAAAHGAGLAVILDVVYNHVGASGHKALEAFGPYFTGKYETPWGSALNYDDGDCDPVREWVCQSAEGWVRDFGIDGLRLDAVHAIFDSGPEHIVAEVSRRVKALNPRALVIAESALNDPKVMRAPRRGGWGCSATWADDFHHAARTLLTDEREGYYADFGQVADLAKAMGRPFVYDGRYSQVRRKRVGAPAGDLPPSAFVVCTQNHDQVGNRAFGDRLPEPARPLAAFLTLLAPFTPMLFMGEEYGEPAPFQFFADHIDAKIAEATREGRRAEFAAFASFGHEVPDPMSEQTFADSKLTRREDPELAALYRALLAVRRELPAGDASDVRFDEQQRWLRLRRGEFELVANFAGEPQSFGARGQALALATPGDVELSRGKLTLPALGGALLKDRKTKA